MHYILEDIVDTGYFITILFRQIFCFHKYKTQVYDLGDIIEYSDVCEKCGKSIHTFHVDRSKDILYEVFK